MHKRNERRLVALLVVPSVAIILCCLLAVFFVLHFSSAEIARESVAGEQRLLSAVLTDIRKTLSTKVADYAFWDEIDTSTKGPIDPTWAKENLGPYSIDAFSLTHLFIVDGQGKLIYDYTAPNARDGIAWSRMAHALDDVAKDARKLFVPGKPTATDQIVFIMGHPHLIAASVIQPRSSVHTGKEVDGRVLIYAQDLDEHTLSRLADEYDLGSLRVDTRPLAGEATLTLPARSATARAVFSWTKRTRDDAIMMLAMPGVSFTFFVAAVAFCFLTWLWIRVINRLGAAEAAAAAAEEASAVKSAFIANMSHELRTPLNAVIGLSDIMASETLGEHANPAYKEYAGDIKASGENLLSVVNNLLTYANIEAGRHAFRIDECATNALVEEAVERSQSAARSRNIRIAACVPDQRALCQADPSALRNVLHQIVNNAVKFTPEGGEVKVTLARDGANVRIDVADTGPGMPPSFVAMLGRPLSQAETAYAREHGGVGLGIALSIAMLEAMDGSIAFESTPGKGTTAHIRVPLSTPLKVVAQAA